MNLKHFYMLDETTNLPIENSENSSESTENETTSNETSENAASTEVQPEKMEESEKIKVEKVVLNKDTANDAVAEIEKNIATSAEEDSEQEEGDFNFQELTLEELVSELSVLVKEKPVQKIHDTVNAIKSEFNLKFGILLKKEKEKFLAEGGNKVDFKYKNPVKLTYNSILYDYKIKKNEYYAKQDEILNENLSLKLTIIEDLKHLIDNADTETMYTTFKQIQEKWRKVGPIPRAKYSDTWKTYHHHVERFYDLLHLSNDLRELDFKHNLEEKLKLIDRAEELANLEDINTAFKELQTLHKLWKEEVGPVSREHREEVWEKFSEATKKVHDKRHDFYKDIRSQFEDNIEGKLAVIAEIEAIDLSKINSREGWKKAIKLVDNLRNKFFAVGQVPRSKNEQIWKQFKSATKKFNKEKNNFFKDIKNEQLENLNKKKLLVEQAVSLKDSEDWDSVTEIMKKIQSDWKKIGHVPRKFSDKLWKEFKDACNHYFDRLHKKNEEGNKEQLEVLNEKKELLKEIKKTVEGDDEISLNDLKEYVNDWRELGKVPYEMKHIETKFNKLIDKIVDENPITSEEAELVKFENLIGSYIEQKNYRKLDSEQLFIRKKIDEITREIHQLENNIGFLTNVSEDNPLLVNVKNQIKDHKEKLSIWKSKLDYLRRIEY